MNKDIACQTKGCTNTFTDVYSYFSDKLCPECYLKKQWQKGMTNDEREEMHFKTHRKPMMYR